MDARELTLDLPSSVSLRLATASDGLGSIWLSPEERERHDQLVREDRRTRFALGRTVTRQLLADRLGMEPRAVPLGVTESGRLEVEAALHVSLSHAGRGSDAAAAAVAGAEPVGVDIERVGRRHPDLWRRILRPDEYQQLEALGGPTDDAQTLLWVLKESVLKGQGTGLRAGTHSVRLDLEAQCAESDLSGTWQLRFDRLGDLWVAVAFQ